MPKVYFYHLKIVATLFLLFLVGEEKGRTTQMTNKGTLPKVYFYHLRIVATLVLLFLVGEETERTIR